MREDIVNIKISSYELKEVMQHMVMGSPQFSYEEAIVTKELLEGGRSRLPSVQKQTFFMLIHVIDKTYFSATSLDLITFLEDANKIKGKWRYSK